MTDKHHWPRVTFGDVVRLNTDRLADPLTAGIERFVGLEHIEPEDLRIRRWGFIAEGTTFTNRFRPGHVLFGKRRAYQRKVAVADFEGVCSSDIYVFESKDPDMLLPELLPFLCQTDGFFQHAVGTSAGSLSPRTNWTQLAAYELALPPLEEQRRIAAVFRAYLTVENGLWEAQIIGKRMWYSLLIRLMSTGVTNESSTQTGNLVHPRSWKAVRLESVAAVERGKFSHRPRNLPQFYGGPYPFVQTGDVAASRGNLQRVSQTLSEEGLQYSRSFPPNTILLTIAAVIGATAITTNETWCPDSVVAIRARDASSVRFLEYALRYVRPYLEFQVATQTAQKNINLQILRPLMVPWPDHHERETVTRMLGEAEIALASIQERLSRCKAVAKEFQRHFLSGVR